MSNMFRSLRTSRILFHNVIQIRNKSVRKMQNQSEADYMKWVLITIPIASFGLGCWQVKRLQWKLKLIEQLEERTNAEPVEFPQDLWELNTLEYCPVKLKGHFLYDNEILVGPRALIEQGGKQVREGSLATDPKKNQGWIVVTPFKIKDREEIIMVNRGWVPNSMKNPAARASSNVKYEIDLIATVRSTERRPPFVPKNQPQKGIWLYKDLDEMAAFLNCSPVLLDARGTYDVLKGWPIPNQTKVQHRNDHFSYLITWFSLSAFTTFMWVKKYIQKSDLNFTSKFIFK